MDIGEIKGTLSLATGQFTAPLAAATQGVNTFVSQVSKAGATAQGAGAQVAAGLTAPTAAAGNAFAAAAPKVGLFDTRLIASVASGTILGVSLERLASQSIRGLVNVIQESVVESTKFHNSLIGLSSVAAAYGHSSDIATEAAKRLASDGLMTVAESAQGLKNLLSTGFGMQEAETLMGRLTESATFNRQAHYALGAAVVATTEGIKNQNSVLADAVGVTRNLSVMAKDAGIAVADFGDAQRDGSYQAAIFNGFMKETAASVGNVAKYLDTTAGASARLNTQYKLFLVSVGDAITQNRSVAEALKFVTDELKNVTDGMAGTAKGANLVSDAVLLMAETFGGVVTAIGVMHQAWNAAQTGLAFGTLAVANQLLIINKASEQALAIAIRAAAYMNVPPKAIAEMAQQYAAFVQANKFLENGIKNVSADLVLQASQYVNSSKAIEGYQAGIAALIGRLKELRGQTTEINSRPPVAPPKPDLSGLNDVAEVLQSIKDKQAEVIIKARGYAQFFATSYAFQPVKLQKEYLKTLQDVIDHHGSLKVLAVDGIDTVYNHLDRAYGKQKELNDALRDMRAEMAAIVSMTAPKWLENIAKRPSVTLGQQFASIDPKLITQGMPSWTSWMGAGIQNPMVAVPQAQDIAQWQAYENQLARISNAFAVMGSVAGETFARIAQGVQQGIAIHAQYARAMAEAATLTGTAREAAEGAAGASRNWAIALGTASALASGIPEMLATRSKAASTVAGLKMGAQIGTMIMPGIGTAIGAGAGALVGYIKGALSNNTKGSRGDFAKELGFDDLAGLYADLERFGGVGDKLRDIGLNIVGRNDRDANTAWMKEVQTFYSGIELAKKYGLSMADTITNPAQKQNALFGGIAAEVAALKAAGFSDKSLAGAMSEGLEAAIRTATTAGVKIPAALAPVLETFIRGGGLSDEMARTLLGIPERAKVPWQEMAKVAEEFKIAQVDLGHAFRDAQLVEGASTLAEKWHLLVDNGANVGVVMEAMKSKANEALHQFMEWGTEIPASMRPMFEAMQRAGVLTDAAGNKLESLDGLNFGVDLTAAIGDMVAALYELVDVLGNKVTRAAIDAQKALRDMPAPGRDDARYGPVPSDDTGGYDGPKSRGVTTVQPRPRTVSVSARSLRAMAASSGSARPVNIIIPNAIDGPSVMRVVKGAAFKKALKTALRDNAGGFAEEIVPEITRRQSSEH